MARRNRPVWIGLASVILLGGIACAAWWYLQRRQGEKAPPGRFQVRAGRRAYDGAPPVIPHPPFGGPCTNCHSTEARNLPELGIAPPNPHLHTVGFSAGSRCQQCHVFTTTSDLFVEATFLGLAQVPRRGERAYPHAPPTIPHHLFLRESCNACHSGSAVRDEIVCSHAERSRCIQCHARDGALR